MRVPNTELKMTISGSTLIIDWHAVNYWQRDAVPGGASWHWHASLSVGNEFDLTKVTELAAAASVRSADRPLASIRN